MLVDQKRVAEKSSMEIIMQARRYSRRYLYNTVACFTSPASQLSPTLEKIESLSYSSSLVNVNDHQQNSPPNLRHKETYFSVAPMMGYTNRHQRKFMRLISKSALLYTEMVVASTIIHTNKLEYYLGANFEEENPLILQLGGSDPNLLADAASIAFKFGYNRFNLNVGCPSDRVSGSGCFGASLMMKPDLVADICLAIADKTTITPSVKCRIGVNNEDSYAHLASFIDTVSRKGNVSQFIVHARKAVLDPSWSPTQNRTIPPLKYEFVYQLLTDFPHLYLGINGGIKTYEEISSHLENEVHEVMIGRGVIDNPFYYRNIDGFLQFPNQSKTRSFLEGENGLALPSSPSSPSSLSSSSSFLAPFTSPSHPQSPLSSPVSVTRGEVLRNYAKYLQQLHLHKKNDPDNEEKDQSDHLPPRSLLIAPIMNLFTGCPNGKLFRRLLSETDKEMLTSSMKIADAILRASEVIPIDTLES